MKSGCPAMAPELTLEDYPTLDTAISMLITGLLEQPRVLMTLGMSKQEI